MAQQKKDNRFIIRGEEARKSLLQGARFAYDAVTATYGPKGTNVMIEKPFGRPLTTRDGVSVARDTYTSNRPVNMGAQRVLEASETTNRIAGDGTTATVAFTYHLMRQGDLAISAGQHPMEVKDRFKKDSYAVLDKLESIKKPVAKGQLKQVATVSSGDPLLGELISDAIERVGVDGGIITEKALLDDVEREYVDGYYLQSGFQALQSGKKELIDPFVIVSIRRLSSAADALDLLKGTMQVKNLQPGTIPRLLLIGNFEEAAYNMIVENINRGVIDAIIIKTPPHFGDMGKALLEDIAVYAGCQPITDSSNTREFSAAYVGSVNKVVANKSESTLFGDKDSEAVRGRVAAIKDQIEVEQVDAISEKLKERVAKLEGKIALFRIGGATDSVKEEVEFRVEDAIHATRAAASHGIVPGGGVTLLELSKVEGISEHFQNALRDTFKQLLVNANLPAEVKLDEALKAPEGHGFNLREGSGIVDMIKSGVIDPALVVEQVVKNATASATDMITTDTLIVYEDEEK